MLDVGWGRIKELNCVDLRCAGLVWASYWWIKHTKATERMPTTFTILLLAISNQPILRDNSKSSTRVAGNIGKKCMLKNLYVLKSKSSSVSSSPIPCVVNLDWSENPTIPTSVGELSKT